MADKYTVIYFARQGYMAELSGDRRKYIVDFCMNLGMISSKYECPRCAKSMTLTKVPRESHTDGYVWVCREYGSNAHYIRRSVRLGSCFERSKLCMLKLIMMIEFFVSERTQKDVMNVMNVSGDTVCDWRQFFREICFDICLNDSVAIGGVGMEVEMDESKFSKRKFCRNGHVDGEWVFGGVERGSGRCFLKVVERRDKGTLLDIIKTFILPGTTVYSHVWKNYDCLGDEELEQLRVDRSLCFKDLETGGRTNAMDGTRAAVKRKLPSRTVSDCFDFYLAEYIWRKSHATSDDLMRTFLEGVKQVYPPRERD